jgi:membrane fusion protein, multidrug efflux system
MNDSVTAPEARTTHEVGAGPTAPDSHASPATPDAHSKPSRRRGLIILGLVVVLCGTGYGAYWFLYARHFESTDDAYVNGDVVQITSEVPGTVIGLHADDTQFVARDQLLLDLDPADAEVAVKRAEANLGRAVRAVRALFAQADQLRAEIVDREVALQRSERDNQRRAGLLSDGAVSSEEFQHTQEDVTEVRAALAAARDHLNGTKAQIDGTSVATNPEVLAAVAAVRDAWLALRRTSVSAPVRGVIARRSVRVGQPVTLRADVYGGKAVYHGKLVGLSAGTGSAFALLPAQNASGNWIKIVQRLPVRVQLDPDELRAHPLRIGLSVTATVDIRDTSGPLVSRQVRRVPIPSQPSLANDSAVEARIARIIQENLGGTKSPDRLSANWGYGKR